MAKKKPNLILIGIDSLRADHMSLLRLPAADHAAHGRVRRGRARSSSSTFSPHIPTTPGYSSMFTGMDCFGTDVVALRHEGRLRREREDAGRDPRARTATTPPASASAATRPRAASRSTSTSPAGAAGTRAAARRPRT